ncbi:MAG: DUF3108 domain-containing protein [Bacteroidota bacterium]
MKTLVLLFFTLLSSAQYNMVRSRPITKGELLEFKLSYGWFTIGKASMETDRNFSSYEGEECYKVDITGKTAGLVGAFSKVNDKWGAIVRKDDFLPYYSYRDLEEGNYRKDEKAYFEYDSMRIRVEDYDVKADRPRPTEFFEIEKGNTFDMIGGLMYARSLDYRNMKAGDTIRMDAYFDKTFYDFAMVYHGVESVRTKPGRINCIKLVPVMPDNKLFRGDNPVTFWISADANRLPLKVEASMFFGTAYCELTSYKNVKSGIDFD